MTTRDLFGSVGDGDSKTQRWTPLAERMRPRTLAEFVGQEHLLGEGKILAELIGRKKLASMILYGPPGTGKTTLAAIYAREVDAVFQPISAVSSGVKKLRQAIEGARVLGLSQNRPTVLFVDELHRFNKSQQDALLPHVEKGTITLLGATTENPSFEVIKPLHSRCRILEVKPLSDENLKTLVLRAKEDPHNGFGQLDLEVDEDALEVLVSGSNGDARSALNTFEIAVDLAMARSDAARRGRVDIDSVEEARQKRTVLYDKNGDAHYQIVSAFIKSMRGSDPDASLYYLVRMLEAGEDPLFILRRILIFASEDIGNADPQALQVAASAMQSFQSVGLPEGVLPLTQAVTYMATAPKSNAVIMAYGRARKDVREHPNLEVPRHLVNAPTPMMKELGYGKGYRYPHNFDGKYVHQDYRPDRLQGRVYYEPTDEGYEQAIGERQARRKASKDDR